MSPFDNVDTPDYYDKSQVDPNAADIELSLVDEPDEAMGSEMIEFEDGSVEIGEFEDEDGEMPPMDQIPHSSNLVAYFDDADLTEIAEDTITAWENDDESRKEWKDTYIKGLDLLGMKIEERDEPFEGASGVYHPLLAEAVVQFQAQAYKELLPAGGPVSTRVLGSEDDERISQAERVKDFMNYLIVDVMEEYDPNMDQLLFHLPLAGSAFKKTYFDPIKERTVSTFVRADNITVPYSSSDLETTARIVHDFTMSGNDLLRYQESGFYADTHIPDADDQSSNDIQNATDELTGITPTTFEYDETYDMLEAHIFLDHDLVVSEGGVALPHIVTIERSSRTILAIRRNWQEGDEMQKRVAHFTHYKFLPGFGFYGFGLIHMIGGLTKSVTAILRQLIDAGTFSNLPGGFKAKGMRVAGEDEPISPGEWRDVDSVGGTIRDSLMPLPYKEPSNVLAMLLGSLVEAGQRFAGIADMQVGDTSGQQQPVGTTVAMLERGTKVMSSIHKRLHRAQKQEFKILARLIYESLPDEPYPYATQNSQGEVIKTDFDDRVDVIPVSDPNIFSMAQRIMLASQQLEMAQSNPKVHNIREAYRRMYVAMGVDEIETLLKPEEKPEPLTPMQEHRNVFQNKKLEPLAEMNHQAHLKAHLAFMKHPALQGNFEFSSNLIQDIMGHISFLAQAQVEQAQQQGQQVDVMEIEAQMFEQMLPQLQPAAPPPDPLAKLQQRQLDIEEADKKSKDNIAIENISSKERIADGKLDGDMQKVNVNERIESAKNATARFSASQNPAPSGGDGSGLR